MLFGLILLLVGCQPEVLETELEVVLIADSEETSYIFAEVLTVEDVIAHANIQLGELDRITPPLFAEIDDGMRITIVRVSEEVLCEQVEIPFEQEIIPNESLLEGEERLGQIGEVGLEEVCFRTITEDGVPGDRTQTGTTTIINEPINEVIFVGIAGRNSNLTIVGTIAYINNGNAWIIQGDARQKQTLSIQDELDSLVFTLSQSGEHLLYTTKPPDEEDYFNQLGFINLADDLPIQLAPTDVLGARWVPNQANRISYTTGEKRDSAPYWQALNNLLFLDVDLQTGKIIDVQELVPESSGGVYGWWGTVYEWSPDGAQLAWVQADGMGLVNLDTGGFRSLLRYPEFNTTQPWSWRANVSWSWDSQLITTTSHGESLGNEAPENSPAFHATILQRVGNFTSPVVQNSGIWSSPKFSPPQTTEVGEVLDLQIAYLHARDPLNSVSGQYDLVIADQDGSNKQKIFPSANDPGIVPQDFGITNQDFTWSPDGTQIAIIYQGNLWIIGIADERATQITFDGDASNPVWVG